METLLDELLALARDAQPGVSALCANSSLLTVQQGPANPAIVPARRGGRKRMATPERVALICGLLARGETEQAACLRAGIGRSAWIEAKKTIPTIQAQVAAARDKWAELRHRQHVAARRESQWCREANRKPLRETPTKQAQMVVWHLSYRVSLEWAAIPQDEVQRACERFNLAPDTWERQARAFGLMGKVYAKRAKLRGTRPVAAPAQGFDWSAWGTGGGQVEESFEDRFRP